MNPNHQTPLVARCLTRSPVSSPIRHPAMDISDPFRRGCRQPVGGRRRMSSNFTEQCQFEFLNYRIASVKGTYPRRRRFQARYRRNSAANSLVLFITFHDPHDLHCCASACHGRSFALSFTRQRGAMSSPAAEVARRLAEQAESVCRYYLSNGRRSGGYWQVGDVDNTPGRSLYVRLSGPATGPGAAGKWVIPPPGNTATSSISSPATRTCPPSRMPWTRHAVSWAAPTRSPGPSHGSVGTTLVAAARRLFAVRSRSPATSPRSTCGTADHGDSSLGRPALSPAVLYPRPR